MGKNLKAISWIVLGIFVMLAGILILCNKDAFVKVVVVCSSLVMISDGAYSLFSIKKYVMSASDRKLNIARGISALFAGILGVIMPLVAAQAVVSIIVILFVTVLVFSAFVSIKNAFVLKKLNADISVSSFVLSAVACLVVAIVLVADPWKIATTLATIIGILVTVAGVATTIWGIRVFKLIEE